MSEYHVFPASKAVSAIMRTVRDVKNPVIALAGLPAAGKTTLARQIAAQEPQLLIIDKDEVALAAESAAMAAVCGNPMERDHPHYRNTVLPRTLAIVRQTVSMAVDSGLSCLVVSPFVAQAQQAMATETSLEVAIRSNLDLPVTACVWLSVSEEEQYRRMVSRAAPRDSSKLNDFRAYRDTVRDLYQFSPGQSAILYSTDAIFAGVHRFDQDDSHETDPPSEFLHAP